MDNTKQLLDEVFEGEEDLVEIYGDWNGEDLLDYHEQETLNRKSWLMQRLREVPFYKEILDDECDSRNQALEEEAKR